MIGRGGVSPPENKRKPQIKTGEHSLPLQKIIKFIAEPGVPDGPK